VVEGSRVIPMKTPLTLELQKGYLPANPQSPSRQFTVGIFLEEQRALGREVGLIVDLSNHDCLYTEDIPPGLEYMHFHFIAKRLPDPGVCAKVRLSCPKTAKGL
jgi:hypothetical protein